MAAETMIKEVKERNLTQSTFLNAASSLLNYGTSILVALLLNPLLLTFLGPSLFGVWKICQRLLTYVSAADGRASQALKWTIASRRSTTDIEQKQREIGCAIVVWLRFLPLVLVAGSLLAWFSPWFIRGLPAEHFTLTRLTCAILVVNLLLFPLKSIPESVMVGMNLGYKTTWINAFGNLLGGLLMAVAAWIGWGLVGLATALLLASLFRGVAILFQARGKLPWLSVRKPEKGEVGEFFNFSIWVLAWTFINKFLLSSDIIILGLVSSASLVASYTLTFYVVQTLINLSAIMVSSGMPGMGDIVGRGELKKAAAIRSEINASSWLMAVVVGSMVLLWNRPFISLWVGAEHFVGFGENLLMVILMTQLIFIRNDAFIVDVTLQIRTKVLWGAFSTVVGLALALMLGLHLTSPITGVLVGLIGGRLILTVLYPMLVGRQLQENLLKISPEFVRGVLVMAVIYGLACYGAPRIGVESWLGLLMSGTVSLFVIGGAAFFLGLNGEQRRQILSRARQLSFK
jgi:O-antigen/teichoic acid export membrane protein